MKTFVSALALAGSALAQNSCSSSATLTVQNAGDVAAITGCTTYTGSIAIQTGVTSDLAINGVRAIQGNLVADNVVGLPSLGGDSLQSISGTFSLTNMTLLTGLNFPQLSTVGSIVWQTLPRLSSLSFTTGISRASTVSITDSQLFSLDGIKLNTVDRFTISNNLALTSINMPLRSINTAFSVEFNGRNMTVDFPNLVNAYNMTFRNASTVNLPALSSVNDTLGFYGNDFTTFSAANLTSLGNTLSFASNLALTNISFPALTDVKGSITLSKNPNLLVIDGFPKVTNVGGAVDINGNWTNVTLPGITGNQNANVAGAFNLQSSADITNTCNTFAPLASPSGRVIKGKYTCAGKQANPGGVGTNPSGTSGSGSTSSQSGGAVKDLYARSAAVTGVLGVFAAMFGML